MGKEILYFWHALVRRLRNFAGNCVRFVKTYLAALGRRLTGKNARPRAARHHHIHVPIEALAPRRIWHTLAGKARLIRTAWEAEAARIPLHTNASGDFTLLARDAWDTTRAYPELEMFSMHIDGLYLYEAHYAGFEEIELTAPVFHIEHNQGFKPAPHDVKNLNTRLERAAIPQITNEQFMRWTLTMYRTKEPIVFNGDDWGFAGVDLPETVVPCAYEEVSA